MAIYRETVKGSLLDNEYHYRVYDIAGNLSQDIVTHGGKVDKKAITSTNTGGFHRLLKCGKLLPLNPVLIEHVVSECLPGEADAFYLTGERFIYGGWTEQSTNTHLQFPETSESLYNAAVLAAMSNAASDRWDVLTFLAEFNKSVQTLAGIARVFNMRTLELARRARRASRNPIKKFGELWLEARYGIRPMMYDAADAVKAIQKTIEGGDRFVKGRGIQTQVVNDTWTTGWVDLNGETRQLIEESMTGKVIYRGCSYVGLPDSASRSVLQFDPLVTFWEEIPYSFVVDWFINIGAYVQTINPTLSGDYLANQGSVKLELTIERKLSWEWHTTKTGGMSPAIIRIRKEVYRREPVSLPPFPPLVPRLTLPKLVDLVFLFSQGRRNVHRELSAK